MGRPKKEKGTPFFKYKDLSQIVPKKIKKFVKTIDNQEKILYTYNNGGGTNR